MLAPTIQVVPNGELANAYCTCTKPGTVSSTAPGLTPKTFTGVVRLLRLGPARQYRLPGSPRPITQRPITQWAIEGRFYDCPPFPTFNIAVLLCVRVPDVPVNVSVNVPLDAPFGTAKLTVTLAVSDPDVSVTDDGTIVHVEPDGPVLLQVRLMIPWNPVVDDSVSV